MQFSTPIAGLAGFITGGITYKAYRALSMRRWVDGALPCLLQAFGNRLGQLRQPASWTEQLWGSQPVWCETACMYRVSQPSDSHVNVYLCYWFWLL